MLTHIDELYYTGHGTKKHQIAVIFLFIDSEMKMTSLSYSWCVMAMVSTPKLLLLVACFMLVPPLLFANDCRPLTETARTTILSHLSKRWKLGDPAELKLGSEEFIGNTCYRSFTLEGGPLKHGWTIFLSADQRFVMGSLVDTAIDPEQEAKEEALRTYRLLLAEESPNTGPSNALITIVEFGDFQCPYCKQFNEWIKSLPVDTRKHINLVYKHLPLRKHPWARDAAMAASCAGFQFPRAFWLMHDFMFKEQEHLTVTNVRDQAMRFAATVPELDAKQLAVCMENQDAERVIGRDEMLAERLQVRNTPTIFINGEKTTEWPSLEAIQRRIVQSSQQKRTRP